MTLLELLRVKTELLGAAGETDEYGEVVIYEEGILLDGFFADAVGISWVELSRILDMPVVQAKLEEASILRG